MRTRTYSTEGLEWERLLRTLPESVSKTIHQRTTPHGTIFQVLMLMAALLILASEFPKCLGSGCKPSAFFYQVVRQNLIGYQLFVCEDPATRANAAGFMWSHPCLVLAQNVEADHLCVF